MLSCCTWLPQPPKLYPLIIKEDKHIHRSAIQRASRGPRAAHTSAAATRSMSGTDHQVGAIHRRKQNAMGDGVHKSAPCCKSPNGGDRSKKVKRYGLVSYKELPEYMKDNEYILDHYRANWPLSEAFFSLFRWHNETLNVWTHLLGFILFVGLTIVHLVQVPQVTDLLVGFFSRSNSSVADTNISYNSKELIMGTNGFINFQTLTPDNHLTETTRWPFFVFLGGAMFCLLSSSTCHLLACHSHRLNILLLRMDYAGITTMIITSFFPPIYYVFQCDPHWQLIYLTTITAMGAFTIVTLLSPSLSTAKFRSFRAMLFCSMGLFGLVPAVHGCVVNWSNPQRMVTLGYECVMALSYLVGTGFYVSRVPERWRPGCFDLAGHSHQIFHVFVIMGALAHYGAALVFLEWRDRMGCANV